MDTQNWLKHFWPHNLAALLRGTLLTLLVGTTHGTILAADQIEQPTSHFVVLIDGSDGLTNIQKESIKTHLEHWSHQIPDLGDFSIYGINDTQQLSEVEPAVVPIETFLEALNHDESISKTSRIMESVHDITAPLSDTPTTLIVISDLMHNHKALDMKKRVPPMKDFLKTPHAQAMRADLSKCHVQLLILNAPNRIHRRDVSDFWVTWLESQGALNVDCKYLVPPSTTARQLAVSTSSPS